MSKKRLSSKWSIYVLTLSVLSMIFAATPSQAQAAALPDLLNQLRAPYASNTSVIPEINNVSFPQQPTGAYEKFEITFQLNAAYTNPYDPDDINVEGHFIYPDGKAATVPAFFFTPYESVNGKTILDYKPNLYRKTGDTAWKIRFSSGMQGQYQFYITAKDSHGMETRTEPSVFHIGPSSSNGFIQISPTNPMYFEHSTDGSLFYGSGSNIAWVRSNDTPDPNKRSYEYFLNQAKDNSSLTRVWLAHWAWLEWTPNPDTPNTYSYAGKSYYNQQIASAMDSVLAQAEELNLKIILALDDNNELMTGTTYDSWMYHPYNAANGGPAGSVQEYWSSSEVRELYKKRLRYILARWGYSTSLMTLNSWNDMTNPNADQISYLNELRDYVHEVADDYRPVIYGSNFRYAANEVLDYVYSAKEKERTKPNVKNEAYYTKDMNWFKSVLQEQVWDGLVTGDAARMVWPHNMVDSSNSWPVFKSLLNFVSDIPLNKKTWNPAITGIVSAESAGEASATRVITLEPYGDVPNFGVKSPDNEFTVVTEENSQFMEGIGPTLYGSGRKELRNPPTLIFNTPANTTVKMLVEVNEVGSGTNTLAVAINNEPVKSVPWCCGRRILNNEERFVEVPLAAGENRITLDNAGGDWLRLQKIYFILDSNDARSLLTAKGLVSGDEAVLYLNNQTYGELYNKFLQNDAVPIQNVTMQVYGLVDGSYDVTVYDPTTGMNTKSMIAPSLNGKLTILAGQVEKDLALKLKLIDTIAPILTWNEPGRLTGNHYNVAQGPLTVTGRINEPGQVQVNGIHAVVKEDLSFSAVVPLAPGMNRITITASDAAGNTAAPITFNAVPNNSNK